MKKEELRKEIIENEQRIRDLKRTNRKKDGVLLFIIILFVSSWMVIPYANKNVDEDGHCLNKLNQYFPEYNFVEADYWECSNDNYEGHSNSCKGVYYNTEDVEKRDGLLKLGQEQVKFFKLTDKADIDYMKSDDFTNFLVFFGCITFIIGCFVSADKIWGGY